MFRLDGRTAHRRTALDVLELMFHATVRSIRKSHGNAMIGLLMSIFQTALMVLIFFFMMDLLGMRRMAIRGDFLLYIMSGIFMFMTHTKAMSAVMGSEGPTSAMMKHSPMNTVISITAAALGSLYLQLLSAGVVLYIYHAAFVPIHIEQPVGMFAMLLVSWGSGVGIGMVFLAAKPWQPEAVSIISQIYMRANMIASGKMFVANSLSGTMLALFDWNPLFHTIDQGRGFIFLNYFPRNSSLTYPIYVMLVCVMIGLMAEFYTRKHASLSWQAKR